MRAQLRLDEGDVCSSCNLRESCDRAYVILKEFKANARTVDIVRTIFYYAIDPLVTSGGEKPPGREVVESSARKLLSHLIELSESSPTPVPVPAHSKPAAQDVEMKKGDWIWMCPKCDFINFSRNIKCLKCQTEGPKRVKKDEVQMKRGDWTCPKCGIMNYASNVKCLKYPEPRPKKNPGDWICPKCELMNFASRDKCFRCEEPNPYAKKYPGDWSCPKCDYYNFARNTACLKCDPKHSKEQSTSEYEEHVWKLAN